MRAEGTPGNATKVMAVDHGEQRIGLAISDSTGTLARPLGVVAHTSRGEDAVRVGAIAAEQGAGLVVVGQSTREDGEPNLAGRRAARFAEELRERCGLAVALWDEAFSTRDARAARIAAGSSRKRRRGHLDAEAAAVILQSYLDARSGQGT